MLSESAPKTPGRLRGTGTAPGQARGFTLIELIITLVLLGMLIAVGLPAFKSMIGNAQVRTVAEALQNGLRLARTEALRSNTPTVFALTAVTPAPGVAADPAGRNWFVQTAPATGSLPEYIQGGALGDVANAVVITAPVAVCFNSNGRLSQPLATAVVLPSGVANCAAPATIAYQVTKPGMSDRTLVVQVKIGGEVRLCDVARVQSTLTPDGC